MLGLIKKDMFLIKNNLKLLLIIFIAFTITALENQKDLSFLPAFISMMMCMSAFSYDEYNKWDSYAISLPNGRKNTVKAKYLATIILILTTTIITTIISLIIGYTNNNLNIDNILSNTLGCLFALILIQSVIYPLIFKLGIEKGRIYLFVGIFGLSTIMGLLLHKIKLVIPKNLILLLNNYYIIILLVLMITFLLISYKISDYIYQNKEF